MHYLAVLAISIFLLQSAIALGANTGARNVLTEQALQQQLSKPEYQQRKKTIARFLEDGMSHEVLAAIKDLDDGTLVGTKLLSETLFRIANYDVDATTEVWVKNQTIRPVVYWTVIEEGIHRIEVPAIDIGAQARYATRQWRKRKLAKRFLPLINQASPTILVIAKQTSEPELASDALAQAVRMASDQNVANLIPMAKQALLTDPQLIGAASLVVANRTKQLALAGQIIEYGPTAIVRQLLSDPNPAFDQRQMLALTQLATTRVDSASFAWQRMSAYAENDPAIPATLMQSLSDPQHGGSIALAIARLSAPGIELALFAKAQDNNQPIAQRNALLALSFMQTDSSRRQLEKLLDAPTTATHYQQAIKQWLGK